MKTRALLVLLFTVSFATIVATVAVADDTDAQAALDGATPQPEVGVPPAETAGGATFPVPVDFTRLATPRLAAAPTESFGGCDVTITCPAGYPLSCTGSYECYAYPSSRNPCAVVCDGFGTLCFPDGC